MQVKTTGQEYFYSISGLDVPKDMVSDTLVEDIEYLVDWVPKNINILRSSVLRDMKLFESKMKKLHIMLSSIHAHWLEQEAVRILRMVEINDVKLCQQLCEPFITNLNTLAIDIQTVNNADFETNYWQRDEIEKCKNIINSMKIIAALLKKAEFEKAVDVVLSIHELSESTYAIPFMSAITKKNVERAMNVMDEITEIYTKKIDAIIIEATSTDERKKIVVVDDMPETLTALELMLNAHYHVFAFSDGKEALEFIDNAPQPDAFLLDIDMPVMNGLKLAKNIRSRKKFEHTPILFLTARSTRETVVKAALYGTKAFIVKPASKDIIISKLSSCI